MDPPPKPPILQYLTDAEWRRRSAEAIFEVVLREEGAGDPAYVYDEEKELFRFRDGKFAFSRERGRMDEEL